MNKYLAKGFFIIGNESKQLSILPNDVRLRIHAIEKLKTDFVMKKKHSNLISSKHYKEITHTV